MAAEIREALYLAGGWLSQVAEETFKVLGADLQGSREVGRFPFLGDSIEAQVCFHGNRTQRKWDGTDDSD